MAKKKHSEIPEEDMIEVPEEHLSMHERLDRLESYAFGEDERPPVKRHTDQCSSFHKPEQIPE